MQAKRSSTAASMPRRRGRASRPRPRSTRLERDGADARRHDRHAGGRARARDRACEYAAIAVVANYAAGRGDSARAVPLDKIGAVLERGDGPRATHHREAAASKWQFVKCCAWAIRACWQTSQPVEEFDTPELAELLQDMRDTMAHLNGAGLAAPQIGVGLRVVIFGVARQPALSRCRGGARHRAHQSGPHAARRRGGGGLGRLPVRARHARLGAALHAAALRGFDENGKPLRARGRRLPRPRRAARVRPPRRRPLSDADPRLHAGSASTRRCFPDRSCRRKTELARASSCSSCSTVFGVRKRFARDQEHVLGAVAEGVDARGLQVDAVARQGARDAVEQAGPVARRRSRALVARRARRAGGRPRARSGSARTRRDSAAAARRRRAAPATRARSASSGSIMADAGRGSARRCPGP